MQQWPKARPLEKIANNKNDKILDIGQIEGRLAVLANVLNLYDHGRIQDNLAKMVVFLGQRL